MTDDEQRLSDMAHALDMELHEAWEARRSALTAGDPDAVAEFRCEMRETLLAAKRTPLAVLARHQAAVAVIMARATGRAVSAPAAPQRDPATIANEIYAQRAATVREAVAAAGGDVPDTSAPPHGLPDAADLYRRRAVAAGRS